uniref:3'-5' exonuclease domain-containing protein n=1 Tax=Gouania willdenowi TaxID=441366 RepID=A0A8C5H4E6_GOUWI
MNHTTQEEEGLDPAALKDELFELWNWKNVQMLHHSAQHGFSKLSDPLGALIEMLEQCPGKQKGRSQTLGSKIVSEFQTWMEEHPQVKLSSLPQQKAATLQLRALGLLTESNPTFVEGLINIYQLQSLDAAPLRQHIATLQSRNCYKEAVTLSIKLQLHTELDMETMCVPLILQDKLTLAETFVSGHSQLETQLVIMLDSWCHPSFNIDEIRARFPHISPLKNTKSLVHPKMITKHIFRLVDKFKIDQELCPNALHNRRLDTLRYLMYKTFVEKSMTEQNWADHVQFVVADDLELQIHLVEMLVRYRSLKKASQWSLRYNIPRDRLPYGVWDTQQDLLPDLQQMSLESASSDEWVPLQAHQQRFYQVPLGKDKVHFVDTLEALQGCRGALLKEGGVVGVDMEWQPTFGCTSAQQVALIQLAVCEQAFLVDLCAAGFGQHPQTVDFIRSLFSEPKVLKLGYGMAGGDLRCLMATWHQLLEEPLKLAGVLDLLDVHQKMQRSKVNRTRKGPSEVLVGEDCAEKGLSLLVQQVLGRPLDKTEQMSNWEKRPLRISQIRYAVADAYCLLDVYSVLSRNPARFGLPAELHKIPSLQSQASAEKKKAKRAKAVKQDTGKEVRRDLLSRKETY